MMKSLYRCIFLLLILASCNIKEDIELTQTSLVGKWTATGRIQSRNADGTWSDWYVLQTFAAEPVSIWEFTSDGRFLRDGKAGGGCCLGGNKYKIEGNELIFSDFPKQFCVAYCINCRNWSYELTDSNTLILNDCHTKKEYHRTK